MNTLQNLLLSTALTSGLALSAIPAFASEKHDDPSHENTKQHKTEATEKHEHGDDHHHHDPEPHHGGIVSIVDDRHHELVIVDDKKIVFYAEGLPEGKALKNVQVDLVLLQGKKKQELVMELAGDDQHRFEVSLDLKLKSGYKAVAVIKQDGKKNRLVRFEIPAE